LGTRAAKAAIIASIAARLALILIELALLAIFIALYPRIRLSLWSLSLRARTLTVSSRIRRAVLRRYADACRAALKSLSIRQVLSYLTKYRR